MLSLPLPLEETARASNLTAFADSLAEAALIDTLSEQDTLTVFAPNDAAFEAIQSALQNSSESELQNILQYHAAPVPYYSRDLLAAGQDSIHSLAGEDYVLRTNDDGDIFVNNARVVASDIIIPNGVLHVLDAVLNPDNTTVDGSDSEGSVPAFPGAEPAGPDSGAAGPNRALEIAAVFVGAAILANF